MNYHMEDGILHICDIFFIEVSQLSCWDHFLDFHDFFLCRLWNCVSSLVFDSTYLMICYIYMGIWGWNLVYFLVVSCLSLLLHHINIFITAIIVITAYHCWVVAVLFGGNTMCIRHIPISISPFALNCILCNEFFVKICLWESISAWNNWSGNLVQITNSHVSIDWNAQKAYISSCV